MCRSPMAHGPLTAHSWPTHCPLTFHYRKICGHNMTNVGKSLEHCLSCNIWPILSEAMSQLPNPMAHSWPIHGLFVWYCVISFSEFMSLMASSFVIWVPKCFLNCDQSKMNWKTAPLQGKVSQPWVGRESHYANLWTHYDIVWCWTKGNGRSVHSYTQVGSNTADLMAQFSGRTKLRQILD